MDHSLSMLLWNDLRRKAVVKCMKQDGFHTEINSSYFIHTRNQVCKATESDSGESSMFKDIHELILFCQSEINKNEKGAELSVNHLFVFFSSPLK